MHAGPRKNRKVVPLSAVQLADGVTARRTWRDWVGLYGSDEKVVIRLTDDADGSERLLVAWG
ncbi:hypothetical protein CLM62_36425 [Streptomyces sp. SA15]|nr:hypothetical protein CLM62_36425 [Streptomyces sp. SA15]